MDLPQPEDIELDDEILKAVKSDNTDKVCYIITNSIIAFNADNMSIPAHAISCKKTTMLQCLLDCGYNVNASNSNKRTLLHEAVISNSKQCLQLLLTMPDIDINLQDLHGWTPLFWAVNCGNHDIVKELLTMNCSVTVVDKEGNTILHRIAESARMIGFLDVIIQRGCDIHARNIEGETPLMLAAGEGTCETIEAMLDLGAAINHVSETVVTPLTPLMCAAVCGNHRAAKLLIERGAFLNQKDNEGNTAFLHAVSCGDLTTIRVLINAGCPTSIINNQHHSALHIAAERGHHAVIPLLLDVGVHPKAVDHTMKTALSLAAQHGNYECLLALSEVKSTLDIVDLFNCTPLHWAVAGNYQQCVKALISAGASLNPCSSRVQGALHFATDQGNSDIVRYLLQAGCNVNAINDQEHSALHRAAYIGDITIIELLLAAGVYTDMQTSKGDTALMIASRRHHHRVVELLLDVHSSVFLVNSKRMTALHEACLHGDADICKHLILARSNIDAQELEGDTPLILAATRGYVDIVKLLLRSKCRVDLYNDTGRTALIEAAERNHCDVLQLLLHCGLPSIDVNHQDVDGDSALIVACSNNNIKIVQYLITIPECNLTLTNRWGRSALHEASAVWKGSAEVVDLLLLAGMNPDLADDMGSTPIIIATLSQHEGIVQTLLRSNCDVNKPGHLVLGRNVLPFEIAITTNNRIIAEMLYTAGCNVYRCSLLHRSIPEDTEAQRDFDDWLAHVATRPQSLKLACRVKIRKLLQSSSGVITYKIRILPLPEQIKSYLNLDEMESLVKHPLGIQDAESSSRGTINEEFVSETESEDVSIVQSPSF